MGFMKALIGAGAVTGVHYYAHSLGLSVLEVSGVVFLVSAVLIVVLTVG